METIKVYFCDFWSNFDVNNNGIVNLLKKHYNVQIDSQSPEFLFYSVFGYSHIKYKNCIKVLQINEAVEPNFNECDYAIGFSPMNFGKRYFQNKPYVNFREAEVNDGLLNRRFCNFIYSQDNVGEGALLRKQFCQMLMKYKRVDAPGRILNNMKDAITPRHPRHGNWVRGKLDFIKNYKFTFAIENAEMEGYVTEKLIQPLQMHSIPIYWGAPDVGEYFNTKSFIHLRDFKSLDEAIDYIRYLDNDDAEYMKMLKTNPNLSHNNSNGSFENFLCSIIEHGNKPFSKNPIMCRENAVSCLYSSTAELAEMYMNAGYVKRAKECAELCLSLEMRDRINIYPLLEDIYSDNKNEFITLLTRQKENIMHCPIVRPEYLKELCKIAVCFIHLGEIHAGEELVEYVLQKDPDNLDAKNVLSEKGKRGGRSNKPPKRDYVVKKWEEFQDFAYATAEQRANVFSYCLKSPWVSFVYEQKSYQLYRDLLRLWRPFKIKSAPLVRVGAKNYGGHTMLEPGKQGIAMGLGDYYSEWNFQMAERGFMVYQFGENISEPPKKHANLKFRKISFTKEPTNVILSELFSLKDDSAFRNVVMQIDIRGKEWGLLEAMTESQLRCFSQLVIDFHDLVNESRIESYAKVFRKLNKTHRILNIHYNNNVTVLCFKDFLISNVARITYVRRDAGEFFVSEESFPISQDNPTIASFPEVHIGRFSDILDVVGKENFIEGQNSSPVEDSWKECCQDAVLYTDWIKKKDIYANRNENSSVGYNYLYVLCRLLNDYGPKNILEFEFDQATKLTAQFASSHDSSLTVLANDRERVVHFMKCWGIDWNNVAIQGSALVEATVDGHEGVVYQNFAGVTESKKYNLILLKSPLDKDVRIHIDVIQRLPKLIEDDFAILMDHVEDDCGKIVFKSMMDILEQKGISFLRKDFPAKNHLVSALFSESWKYIAEF